MQKKQDTHTHHNPESLIWNYTFIQMEIHRIFSEGFISFDVYFHFIRKYWSGTIYYHHIANALTSKRKRPFRKQMMVFFGNDAIYKLYQFVCASSSSSAIPVAVCLNCLSPSLAPLHFYSTPSLCMYASAHVCVCVYLCLLLFFSHFGHLFRYYLLFNKCKTFAIAKWTTRAGKTGERTREKLKMTTKMK